jgi:hypothetical protein
MHRARFSAAQMQPFKKLDTLRGKMIVNLFFSLHPHPHQL